MSRSLLTLIFGASLALGGCGFHAKPLAIGAVGGGLAGAGTGAIVGAVIANGDVAASALLGGAIGIPAGLAIAAIYDYNSDLSVKERNQQLIMENQEELYARQREIDILREKIRNEGPHGDPAESLRDYQYNGPTYGNYYR